MPNFFSDWGPTLKLLTGLAATVFGILGIGTRTRDRQGKLNANRWIAFVGIILAGLFALGTTIYDSRTAQKKDREDRLKNEQLILSVRRGIYPLRGITASFNINFDQDIAGLAEYKQSIRNVISKTPNCANTKGFYCYGQEGGKPYSYSIPSTSGPAATGSRTLLANSHLMQRC
jgi:hypothetical protein